MAASARFRHQFRVAVRLVRFFWCKGCNGVPPRSRSLLLPFGSLWYAEPNAISNAIGYAKFFGRSRHAVIRVYDEAGDVIETHEHAVARQI
jgi:hypothetical protein